MNLDEIKKLIQDDGGKIIIVEEGEPIMVITSFKDYAKNKLDSPARGAGEEKKAETPASQEIPEDELKIEDLPF